MVKKKKKNLLSFYSKVKPLCTSFVAVRKIQKDRFFEKLQWKDKTVYCPKSERADCETDFD